MGDVTIATLNGLAKARYGKQTVDLLPNFARTIKNIPFSKSEKIGDSYNQLVLLSRSSGYTFGGSSGTAFSLRTPGSVVSKNATLVSSEAMHRAIVANAVASRATDSKDAFESGVGLVVDELYNTFAFHQELSNLYGGTYAQGGKGFATADSSVNIGATSTTVTMLTAGYAPAAFAGLENEVVNFYRADTGAQINGSTGEFTVSGIAISAGTFIATGIAADITALDGALAATDCYVYFAGASGNEQIGIDVQVANTSATLMGISASAYSLWQGNTYAVGGALTMGKILNGIAKSVNRGLMGMMVEVWINPITWQNLHTDQAALRQYDQSYDPKKLENGSEEILYHGQNGLVKIVPHIYVKQGEGFWLTEPSNEKIWRRVGSREVTNSMPGTPGEMFTLAADKSGFETRLYADQAVFTPHPPKNGKYTGIVNNV